MQTTTRTWVCGQCVIHSLILYWNRLACLVGKQSLHSARSTDIKHLLLMLSCCWRLLRRYFADVLCWPVVRFLPHDALYASARRLVRVKNFFVTNVVAKFRRDKTCGSWQVGLQIMWKMCDFRSIYCNIQEIIEHRPIYPKVSSWTWFSNC